MDILTVLRSLVLIILSGVLCLVHAGPRTPLHVEKWGQ